jgi:hypothetical protein
MLQGDDEVNNVNICGLAALKLSSIIRLAGKTPMYARGGHNYQLKC